MRIFATSLMEVPTTCRFARSNSIRQAQGKQLTISGLPSVVGYGPLAKPSSRHGGGPLLINY